MDPINDIPVAVPVGDAVPSGEAEAPVAAENGETAKKSAADILAARGVTVTREDVPLDLIDDPPTEVRLMPRTEEEEKSMDESLSEEGCLQPAGVHASPNGRFMRLWGGGRIASGR